MRCAITWSPLLALVSVLSACGTAPVRPTLRTLHIVQRQNEAIAIDGELGEAAWRGATRLRDFTFPWEPARPAATEFRSFWTSHALYFAFLVDDVDVVVESGLGNEQDVAKEDRVEIFLSRDDELRQYYCVEVDPKGRVLDYAASFYRDFDRSWDLKGLETAARRTPRGYIVEGMIPRAALKRLGLLTREDSLRVGVFRAEFSRASDNALREGWISWIDPKTKGPDFHVPSALGRFVLKQ